MPDYHTQLEAQIAVFDRHLQLMVQRRSKPRMGDGALIFTELPPDSAPPNRLVAAKARRRKPVVAKRRGLSRDSSQYFNDFTVREPRPPQGPSLPAPRRGSDRYVQFAIMKRTFYMDLPNNTLFPAEAQRLFRQKAGFFYIRDRRWWFMTHQEWQELVRELNPVQKEYLNADTRSAAEDMAFVFYTLWRFPLDFPLSYRRFQFSGSKGIEQGPVL